MSTLDAHERIINAALLGAHADPREDKSDWIRIWAISRAAIGLSALSGDFRQDYHFGYKPQHTQMYLDGDLDPARDNRERHGFTDIDRTEDYQP